MTFLEETTKFSNFEVFFANVYLIHLKNLPILEIRNGQGVRVHPIPSLKKTKNFPEIFISVGLVW